MKIRLLLFTLVCGLVAAPMIQAQERPRQKEPATELEDHMEKIGGAFRALNRQIGDASKNEDSLKRIATIRENAEASLKLDPAKKADIPADRQAKFVADYQAKMKAFIADVNKVDIFSLAWVDERGRDFTYIAQLPLCPASAMQRKHVAQVAVKQRTGVVQVLFGIGLGDCDARKRFVEDADDAALFGEWWNGNFGLFDLDLRNVRLGIASRLSHQSVFS